MERAARSKTTRLICEGMDTSHQGCICWDVVPWVPAAARGRFLLCLQEQVGHSNLCSFQVIRHLSPFFDNQRGLESTQQQFLQISLGKYISGSFQHLLTLSMLPCKAQPTAFSPL